MEEHWLFPRNPKYSILLFLNGIIFCHILEIKVQNVSRLRLVIPLFLPCNYHIIFLFIHDYWLEIFSTNQIHPKNNNTLLIKQYNKRFLKTRAVMQRFSPLVTIAIWLQLREQIRFLPKGNSPSYIIQIRLMGFHGEKKPIFAIQRTYM